MTAGGIEHEAQASEEMSLRDYWAMARRRKWYLVVPVLFALGYSLATSAGTTPMYRSKADVLVQAAPVPGAVSSETAMTTRTLNNELLRAQGSAIQDEVRSVIGDEPVMSVGLAQDKDADLFVFTAESRSAQRAADAANAYAETYVASRQADLAADFQSQADVLQQQLDAAQDRLDEASEGAGAEELRVIIAGYRSDIDEVQTAARLAEESGASVVNVAAVPVGPYAPQPVRSALLAVFLGLFAGFAAAFIRDFTDNHIRTPEALEKATGLPTSAVVPRLRGWKKTETHVVILEDSSSPQAEAYRSLRAKIQFRRVDRQIRSLMVTSARPGEGKTTTSSNLAVAFAAAGENTALVDLDLRRPRIHKFFNLDNDHGMSTVLLGADLESAIRPLSSVPNLSVVPAGPSTGEASEILHDDSLGRVLDELRSRFDIVVVDTPPVLAVADPLTISHFCDGVLLVVSASGTDKRDAERAAGQLATVAAPTIGAVLNNYSAAESGYSYSYAYSDYSPVPSKAETPRATNSAGAEWQVADDVDDASPPKLSRRQKRKLGMQGGLDTDDEQSLLAGGLESAGTPIGEFEVGPNQGDLEMGSTTIYVGYGDESDVSIAPDSPSQEARSVGGDLNPDWAEPAAFAPNDLDSNDRSIPADEVPKTNGIAPNTTNGHSDVGLEEVSRAQFQEYLRAELRQARIEHAQASPVENLTTHTSEVVLISGPDSSAGREGLSDASNDAQARSEAGEG